MTRIDPLSVWAGLFVLFGIDMAITQKADGAIACGLTIAAVALCMFVPRWRRVAAAVVTALAVVALLGPAESTLTAFVMWAAAAISLFPGRYLRPAVHAQVVIVYLFAAANKGISERFVGGHVLAEGLPWFPWLEGLSILVVAGELALAVLVLTRSRWAVPAIVLLHVPTAFFMGGSVRHVLSLLLYGALMAWGAWFALRRSTKTVETDLGTDDEVRRGGGQEPDELHCVGLVLPPAMR